MTYIRQSPSSSLSRYIDYFYYLDGPMPSPREKIFPLPRLDLKINLGGALHMYELGHDEPFATPLASWWTGVWSRPHVVRWSPDVRLFGVSFIQESAYAFLQLPLTELHNQVVELAATWGQFAVEIRERLSAASTVEAGFTLLEQLLLTRLQEVPRGSDIVRYALAEIARHHGVLSIQQMSQRIGVSQNHLNTLVKRMLGIPPKELARFHRFEHMLRSLDPTRTVDWTWIAHQSCFYDLSHLNKDFVAFTGGSPTDYLLCLRQIHNEIPEQDKVPHKIPID